MRGSKHHFFVSYLHKSLPTAFVKVLRNAMKVLILKRFLFGRKVAEHTVSGILRNRGVTYFPIGLHIHQSRMDCTLNISANVPIARRIT